LYETSLLTSGFNLDEPQNFASRIHRMIKLGMSLDDTVEETAVTAEDLPPLESEVEASNMEEVD